MADGTLPSALFGLRCCSLRPESKHLTCVVERAEQRTVQQLTLESAFEALDEGVLGPFVRCNVVPLDMGLLRPAQNRYAGKSRSIIANDGQWCSPQADECAKFAGHTSARARGVGDKAETPAGKIVDGRKEAEVSAVGQCVAQEVERRALVRPPCSKDCFAATATANL